MKTCRKGLHQYLSQPGGCPECKRDWKLANSNKFKEYAFKHNGIPITLDQYNQIFTNQNGCCAICDKHQSDEPRALAVDHDHETGKVRGLLCNNCNRGIGHLKDSEETLLKAASYLAKTKEGK
jgi:hypothetical protein